MIVTITKPFRMNLATISYQFILMVSTNSATRRTTLIVSLFVGGKCVLYPSYKCAS
jgi:hypothetical protein